MQENKEVKLFTKILNVVSKVEKIEKSGHNAHQKYDYATEEDLINAIRQLLVDNKLLITTDSETKDVQKVYKYNPTGQIISETLITTVNTTHTFCDTETGHTHAVKSTGAGADVLDKGVFKAITGSLKYFLNKNFMVPTEDDPENDGVTPKKEVTSTASKGFSRSKPADTSQVVTAATITTVEVPPASKVADTIPAATTQVSQTAKPGFSRRSTTTSKAEPNFP